MMIRIRAFADNWPGRLALLTALVVGIFAWIGAVIAVEPGMSRRESIGMGIVFGWAACCVVAAPAMLAGFAFHLVPSLRHVARSLVMYGAAVGAIGFGALLVGMLLN